MIVEVIVAPIIVILILGALAYGLIKSTSYPKNFPPGPKICPITGTSDAVSKLDPVTSVAYSKLGQIYGPLTGLYFGDRLGLLVNGHDAIKEVCDREDFNSRPSVFNFLMKEPDASANQTGIVCNTSSSWTTQKSCAKEFIANLIESDDSKFEAGLGLELQNIICKFTSEALKPNHDETGFFVMEVLKPRVIHFLWYILTGIRADENELPTILRQAETFRVVNPLLMVMAQHPTLQICPYFSKIWNANIKDKSELRSMLQKIVDNKTFNKPAETDESKAEASTFTDFMKYYLAKIKGVSADDKQKDHYNTIQLIESTADLFGAGAETTSNFISYGFLYMALNLDAQVKVHQELDAVVGLDRLPRLTDRDNMPYTMAVAEEILRMSGPAPVSVPHANFMEAKLHEFTVPKDTIVVLNYSSVHMDKAYWGDPEVFRPERFLDDQNKFVKSDRVFPFGLGTRACPGEKLARATFFMLFVGLMQHFDIEPVMGAPTPTTVPAPGITMAPQTFRATLTPRIHVGEDGCSCTI